LKNGYENYSKKHIPMPRTGGKTWAIANLRPALA
jgi:hypothetical protein